MAISWNIYSYNFVSASKIEKMAVLFLFGLKIETETTLFYESLDTGKNQVPLFFHLEVN